jgi:hypothetical protein
MELAAARGITQPGGLTSQPQTSNYPAVFTACFRIARRIVEYWRRQGVEISLTGDPTKELRSILGPGGLPRGYRGEDAIGLKRG